MNLERPSPTFPHDLHGADGLFIGTLIHQGIATEDVWAVNDAAGTHLVRRWGERECDAEIVDHKWYVEWAIDQLDHWVWTIDELIKMLNGGEPC